MLHNCNVLFCVFLLRKLMFVMVPFTLPCLLAFFVWTYLLHLNNLHTYVVLYIFYEISRKFRNILNENDVYAFLFLCRKCALAGYWWHDKRPRVEIRKSANARKHDVKIANMIFPTIKWYSLATGFLLEASFVLQLSYYIFLLIECIFAG